MHKVICVDRDIRANRVRADDQAAVTAYLEHAPDVGLDLAPGALGQDMGIVQPTEKGQRISIGLSQTHNVHARLGLDGVKALDPGVDQHIQDRGDIAIAV